MTVYVVYGRVVVTKVFVNRQDAVSYRDELSKCGFKVYLDVSTLIL